MDRHWWNSSSGTDYGRDHDPTNYNTRHMMMRSMIKTRKI